MRFVPFLALLGACAEVESGAVQDTGGPDPATSLRLAPLEVEEGHATILPGQVLQGTITRTAGVWDTSTGRWSHIDCRYRYTLGQVSALPTAPGCANCVAKFEIRRIARTDILPYTSPGLTSSCWTAFAAGGGVGQVLPNVTWVITSRPAIVQVGASGSFVFSTRVQLNGSDLSWAHTY